MQELKYKYSRISTMLSHFVLPPKSTGNVLGFITIFLTLVDCHIETILQIVDFEIEEDYFLRQGSRVKGQGVQSSSRRT